MGASDAEPQTATSSSHGQIYLNAKAGGIAGHEVAVLDGWRAGQ